MAQDNQDYQLAIEEKDQTIAARDQTIADLIGNRHVPRRGDFDNVLCFVDKNSDNVHQYYVIRCQAKRLTTHKRWLKERYPDMQVLDECDDPNGIHRWNRFKIGMIKKPNYYNNHFSLTEENRELLETLLDISLCDE